MRIDNMTENEKQLLDKFANTVLEVLGKTYWSAYHKHDDEEMISNLANDCYFIALSMIQARRSLSKKGVK